MGEFKAGQNVLAFWNDEAWCDATIKDSDGASVTVLWDFDFTESTLPVSDVRAIGSLSEQDPLEGEQETEADEDNHSVTEDVITAIALRQAQRDQPSSVAAAVVPCRGKGQACNDNMEQDTCKSRMQTSLDRAVSAPSDTQRSRAPLVQGQAWSCTKPSEVVLKKTHTVGSTPVVSNSLATRRMDELTPLPLPRQLSRQMSILKPQLPKGRDCNAGAIVAQAAEGTVGAEFSNSAQPSQLAMSETVTPRQVQNLPKGVRRSNLPKAPQVYLENLPKSSPRHPSNDAVAVSDRNRGWLLKLWFKTAVVTILIGLLLSQLPDSEYLSPNLRIAILTVTSLGALLLFYELFQTHEPADAPVDWSRCVRVCIHGAGHGGGVLADPPIGAAVTNPDANANDAPAEKTGGAAKGKTGEKELAKPDAERLLGKYNKSGKLEDALLYHLNEFFQKELSMAPSEEMILAYVDYGDQETKNVDGRVEVEKHRGLMFVPLEGGSQEDPVLRCVHPADKSQRRRLIPVAHDKDTSSAGRLGKWVSVNALGDIRMGLFPPATSKGPTRIFIEAYGDDGFQKLQKFVHKVIEEYEHSPAFADVRKPELASDKKKDINDQVDKQLQWYTLTDWNKADQMIITKRPMYKDSKEYYRNYQQSLFFEGKERILGKEYSLVDQFQNRTGNYAVQGVQRKLNFLLHGPPGTGKSKFARALAMYTGRHVVAFTIRQIEFQRQLVTILDDPRQIWVPGDKAELARSDYTFEELLFVIEEIDVDGDRKVCWQRREKEEETDTEMEPEADHLLGILKKHSKPPLKPTEEKPRLSLDFLLRTLDGGCDTPGRMVVMTTNRMHLLDAALMRPGRVKQVCLSFVEYRPFKQMVLHFRKSHGTVPISKLWTAQVDSVARHVLADFKKIEGLRSSDLDRRQLGLSPALLEEKCMEAHTIQEVFELLADELCAQWERAGLEGQPTASAEVDAVDWQEIAWRQTALYFVEAHLAANAKDPSDAVEEFCELWPENAHGDRCQVLEVVRQMIRDEKTFNEALEASELDHEDLDLTFSAQIEVSADISATLKGDCASGHELLGQILKALIAELRRKWRKPQECGIHCLVAKLGKEPPSLKLYDSTAKEVRYLPRFPIRY